MERKKLTSHDGRSLELVTWNNVEKPKAVVYIAHGMAEHCARYNDFAEFLNKNGFLVVSSDNRGHGATADADSFGYEDGDMFSNDVNDKIHILKHLKQKYNLPLVLFGHSYGSFLTQAVIENNPQADAFVLCGSNFMKGLSYTLCGMIARHLCKNKGGRHPAETIVKLSFSQYEKKIPGKNNWLSRDPEVVKAYNEDAQCGFTCSANFYRSFVNGLKGLYKKEQYSAIDKTKPLLLIAGANDPVGEYGKGVQKLYKFYHDKVGVEDLSMNLYEDARHEILNEINKSEVYNDVLEWLEEKVDLLNSKNQL